MKRKFLDFLGVITLFCLLTIPLKVSATGDDQPSASATLSCCTEQYICAGEAAELSVQLEGSAPFMFTYTDGSQTKTITTSESTYNLRVSPSKTSTFRLLSVKDQQGSGEVCGRATVGVNQCEATGKRSCVENCFTSEIIEQKDNGSCTTYTLKVANDGSCRYALSHFNISVPCGRVTSASNSRGWAMEVGNTDPTTGITGIKVDDIKGFGEDKKAGSFTVTYTICQDGSCGEAAPACGFLVAYKASTCVNYGEAKPKYTPMAGSLTATDVLCYGDESGSVSLKIQGGKAPYAYKWSNGATTQSLENLAAGTYSVAITDAAGKTLTLSAKVNQPAAALEASAQVEQPACGTTTGSIDLSVSGGTAPYVYAWSNGAITEDLASVSAGTYSVVIMDANGCSVEKSFTVNASSNFTASIENVGVCGSESLTAVVNGGASYTYLWSTGETTENITVTESGTYTVKVTDAAGCSASATTQVEISSAQFTVEIIGGGGCGSGSLTADVVGSTGPYTYLWNTGETEESIIPSTSGQYSVEVTDANGCSVIQTKEVSIESSSINIAYDYASPNCYNDTNGWIDITVTGGSGNYTYEWSNGATTEDLENLEAGDYTVVVNDENGCSASLNISILHPTPIYVYAAEITQPNCNDPLGSITVGAMFGEEPYTYTWSNGATGETITGLEPGSYTVTVTDGFGCTAEQVFTIYPATSPTVSIDGGSCGNSTLYAYVYGGTYPYTFEWSSGETGSSITPSEPGTYSVVVTDANGCADTASVDVGEPQEPMLISFDYGSPTCYGTSDGYIDVTVSGGTGSFVYVWSNGATTEDLTNLPGGEYTVTITDQETQCSKVVSVSLLEPNQIYITASNITNVGCDGTTGSITANAMFGEEPYTYSWSNGATGQTISDLAAGSYTVTVTDAAGCSNSQTFTIEEEAAPQVYVYENKSCGSSELYAIAESNSTLTFEWSNGATTPNINVTDAGTYSVTVSTASGCTATAEYVVSPAQAGLEISTVVTNESCLGVDGAIELAVTGGTAPYTFAWSNGATSQNVNGLQAGEYSVEVTDAGGCTSMAYAVVEVSAGVSITDGTAQDATCGMANGNVNITITGGTAPFTIKWSNGASVEDLTNIAAGIYAVEVVDSKGCSATAGFVVEDNSANCGSNAFAYLAACGDTVICKGSNATIPVYFEGNGPWSFTYSDGSSEYTVSTSANPYNLTVAPIKNTTYSLVAVSDANGEGSVAGLVNVMVSNCSKQPVCEEDCFQTAVVSTVGGANCKTVTLQVSTDGSCRYALSHFNIGVPCGKVTSMSNSRGWPMSFGVDPTTGLYGIKVDNINNFGEREGSFTVTYTICNTSSCSEEEESCGPIVAYKAGQCVVFGKAVEGVVADASFDTKSTDMVNMDIYPNPYQAGQTLNLKLNTTLTLNTVNVKVVNINGLVVYSKTAEVYNNQVSLELDKIPSGLYVLVVENGSFVQSKQLNVY